MIDVILQYKDLIPPNIDAHNHDCITQSIDLWTNICTLQRMLTLLPINSHTNLPAYYPRDRNLFLDFISSPDINDKHNNNNPQDIQFMTQTIEHFLNKPNDVASIIAEAYTELKTEEFYFLAFSVLPSMYGFFSSFEQLSYAKDFYCSVLKQVDKELFSVLMIPFFNNATTFKFIEYIFNEFTAILCTDIRFFSQTSSRQQLFEDYRAKFVQVLKVGMCLLPQSHLDLIQAMLQVNYQPNSIFRFLLNDFITPTISLMMRGSNFSFQLESFRQLAKPGIISIGSDFFPLTSNFILSPNIEKTCLYFITTTRDTYFFYGLAQKHGKVPYYLSTMLRNDLRQRLDYNPILLKVFPKCKRPNFEYDYSRWLLFNTFPKPPSHKDAILMAQKRIRRLSSSNSFQSVSDCERYDDFISSNEYRDIYQQASNFEEYLRDCVALQDLQKWNSLVQTQFQISMTAYSTVLLANSTPDRSPCEVLSSVAEILNTRHNQMLFYCIHVKSKIPRLYEQRISSIQVKWSTLLDSKIDHNEDLSIHKITGNKLYLSKAVMTIASGMNSIGLCPFEKRFFRLIELTSKLRMMQGKCGISKDVIKWVVRTCRENSFISSLLIISTLLVKKQPFKSLLCKEETLAWYELEGAVVSILEEDQELFSEYTSLHDCLLTN